MQTFVKVTDVYSWVDIHLDFKLFKKGGGNLSSMYVYVSFVSVYLRNNLKGKKLTVSTY